MILFGLDFNGDVIPDSFSFSPRDNYPIDKTVVRKPKKPEANTFKKKKEAAKVKDTAVHLDLYDVEIEPIGQMVSSATAIRSAGRPTAAAHPDVFDFNIQFPGGKVPLLQGGAIWDGLYDRVIKPAVGGAPGARFEDVIVDATVGGDIGDLNAPPQSECAGYIAVCLSFGGKRAWFNAFTINVLFKKGADYIVHTVKDNATGYGQIHVEEICANLLLALVERFKPYDGRALPHAMNRTTTSVFTMKDLKVSARIRYHGQQTSVCDACEKACVNAEQKLARLGVTAATISRQREKNCSF